MPVVLGCLNRSLEQRAHFSHRQPAFAAITLGNCCTHISDQRYALYFKYDESQKKSSHVTIRRKGGLL